MAPLPATILRWFRLTPDRFVLCLLAAEGFLLLSERFSWFAFNEHKAWTILICIATVAAALLLLLLWFLAGAADSPRFSSIAPRTAPAGRGRGHSVQLVCRGNEGGQRSNGKP